MASGSSSAEVSLDSTGRSPAPVRRGARLRGSMIAAPRRGWGIARRGDGGGATGVASYSEWRAAIRRLGGGGFLCPIAGARRGGGKVDARNGLPSTSSRPNPCVAWSPSSPKANAGCREKKNDKKNKMETKEEK